MHASYLYGGARAEHACGTPLQESLEERKHASLLIGFQNERGGRVKMATLLSPEANYDHPDKVGRKRSAHTRT